MSKFKVRLYIITTIITAISCTPANSDETSSSINNPNNGFLYDSQSTYQNSDESSKVIRTTEERLGQSKETGFDVGFSGIDYNKYDVDSQHDSRGFDSGFDATRPGFSQSGKGQAFDPGFDGTRPGFSHDQSGYGQGLDPGFDGTRPGFSQGSSSQPGLAQGNVRPGYGQAIDQRFDGTRPGFSQGGSSNQPGYDQASGFDIGFDGTRPGFAKGYDTAYPWFIPRNPRQATFGRRYAHPGFDGGFDGTRPGFGQNSRPAFDSGFDGTRPGFGQKVGPSFDASFDGTRFAPRSPREATTDEQDTGSRRRREVDSGLVDNDADIQSVQNYPDNLGQSQKFFFLQPHNKNNWPFIPNWNYPPTAANFPPSFNNIGPYGPGGFPSGGAGPGPYWNR